MTKIKEVTAVVHFKKEELMEQKEECLRLMSEYFDSMIEFNIYDGSEILKKICKLLPINLLINYNLEVTNWLKIGKNKAFYKEMIEKYNEMEDEP